MEKKVTVCKIFTTFKFLLLLFSQINIKKLCENNNNKQRTLKLNEIREISVCEIYRIAVF